MASSNSNVSFWLKFFVAAGIPPGEAANHAVTFTDHRIQTDMLLDLNKEYLNEMGISMMGDVIAILKHAKTVHSQTARDKALKSTPGTSGSPAPRRSTPASRIVGHYLGSANDPDARPMNERTTPKMSLELASRLGPSPAAVKEPAPVVAKIQLLPTQKEEVPVPKSRRVFPEHEGKYKVTMPKGSTPRSKMILQKKGVLPGKSNTVFDRLGASLDGPDTTVPGASVFNRLGGKSVKRPATSTSIDPDDSEEDEPGSPLEYAGVLKDNPAKKAKTTLDLKRVPSITILNKGSEMKPITKTVTKTAITKIAITKTVAKPVKEDTIQSAGVLALGASMEKKSALSRLGQPIVQAATSTSTVTLKPAVAKTQPNKITLKKPGVTARLGPQKMEVSSSEDSKPKGVFSRLGQTK